MVGTKKIKLSDRQKSQNIDKASTNFDRYFFNFMLLVIVWYIVEISIGLQYTR